MREERAWRFQVAALTLLAFCHRLLWLRWPSVDTGDSPEYLQIARWLKTTGMFTFDGVNPSSYRPPLYPAAIAAAMRVSLHPVGVVLVVQAFLGALTVAVVCAIARRAFDRRVALVAGAMLALAPMTARYAAVLLTETLFVFLLLLAVWAWQRERGVASGILFGLALLTRAALLPFIAVVGVYGLWRPGDPHRRRCIVIAAMACATVAPWVARNIVQVRRVTVADAGWGANLLYGTVDLKRGSNAWAQIAAEVGDAPAVADAAGEEISRNRAMQRIRAHPLAWLRVRARQYPWLFVDSGTYLPLASNDVAFGRALVERRFTTIVVKAGFVAGQGVVLLLALFGLWCHRKRWAELLFLWAFPVYLAAAHLPMLVEARFGLPLEPFLVVFAAAGALSVRPRITPSVSITERAAATS
jgi:4-amino-4-deoxy-L-arabinose transferase-like glycosyltransferase